VNSMMMMMMKMIPAMIALKDHLALSFFLIFYQ